MPLKQVANEMVVNAKVAGVVASSTMWTGVWTSLDLISDDIGNLATLVGIILSSVLIYTHWRKGRIEYKKTQLEIKLLMDKEAERNRELEEFKCGIDRRKGEDNG